MNTVPTESFRCPHCHNVVTRMVQTAWTDELWREYYKVEVNRLNAEIARMEDKIGWLQAVAIMQDARGWEV